MIKALIFDKDGTFFDFQQSWGAWMAGFLARLSDGDSEKLHQMADAAGFDLEHQVFLPNSAVIAGTAEEATALLLPFLPGHSLESLTAQLVDDTVNAPMIEVTPLAPFLENLKARGLALGVATNDAERAARAQLEVVNAVGYFDFIAGYDSGFGGKPEPGQLLGFAAQTGIAVEASAMVGDSTHDLEAGRAAGMKTIGVLTGVAGREELAPLSDVVLETIADIPAWLDQMAG